MSQRFPPLTSGDATSLTSELDVEIKKVFGDISTKFLYKDKNGAPVGPFAVLAYTPDLFAAYSALGEGILKQADISPIERELAVLAVVAVLEVPYVLYAHTRIALESGMTEKQIVSASNRSEPAGLTEEESVFYLTALELADSRLALKEEVWQRAETVLGKTKCARLAHIVGFYLYAASLLRLGAVSAPTED